METSPFSHKGVLHYNNWDNSYIPNILKELYLDKVYHPYLKYFQDQIVLDLGANISLFSLYAARYAKHVYAFEPSDITYQLAEMNLRDNGIMNVTLLKKAVAPENGKAMFYKNTNTTMNSLNSLVNNDPEKKEEVETIRLDTFMEQEGIEHIGFAKIDIEGSEAQFFASDSFRNAASKIDALVYEYHSWTQSNPHIINSGLRDLGFSIRQIPSEATIFGAIKL